MNDEQNENLEEQMSGVAEPEMGEEEMAEEGAGADEMAEQVDWQRELDSQKMAAQQTVRQVALQKAKQVIKEKIKREVKKKIAAVVLRNPYFWAAVGIILGIILLIGFIYYLISLAQNDPCILGGLLASWVGKTCEAVSNVVK